MGCGGELQQAATGLPPFETGARNGFHGSTLFQIRKQQQKSFSHKPSDSSLLTENTFHNLQNIKVNIAILQEMTSLFAKFIRELTPNTHSNVIYV